MPTLPRVFAEVEIAIGIGPDAAFLTVFPALLFESNFGSGHDKVNPADETCHGSP